MLASVRALSAGNQSKGLDQRRRALAALMHIDRPLIHFFPYAFEI